MTPAPEDLAKLFQLMESATLPAVAEWVMDEDGAVYALAVDGSPVLMMSADTYLSLWCTLLSRHHPDMTEPLLQFFVFDHLPPHLQEISRPFAILAHQLVGGPLATGVAPLPRNPERTVALRKLLEAKDCAVRALVYKDEREGYG